MRTKSKGGSSALLFNEIQQRAGQHVASSGPKPMVEGPSIPMSVTLDRENANSIREDFLWRLKETAGRSSAAAAKICHDSGLLPAAYERDITHMIDRSLQVCSVGRCEPPAGSHTKVLEVSVTLGDRLFQDKVEWAIALPQNLPERYAASVCSELGLDWQHARAIAGALLEQISLHLQDSGDVRHNEPSPPKGIHRHQIRREEEACCFAGYPRLVARTE